MQDRKIYWIGIRESELENTKSLFHGSITIFGSNRKENYAFDKESFLRYDYNFDNEQWNDFINQTAESLLHKYSECYFMLYDNDDMRLLTESVRKHVICVNDIELLQIINHKHLMRSWMENLVPTTPYLLLHGKDIQFSQISEMLETSERFVLQERFSCGGSGTWICSRDNFHHILSKIGSNVDYAVSPYYENAISLNIHAIIYEDEVLLFPPSVQIVRPDHDRLVYQGGDYIAYHQITSDIKKRLPILAQKVGDFLRRKGYRGICGMDFLAVSDKLYFLEVNSRFQSSTFLLNMALADASCPSLQQFHLDAFKNRRCSYNIAPMHVNLSFYHYAYEQKSLTRLRQIYQLQNACKEVYICVDDELDWNMTLKTGTYLYKLVFQTNISSVDAKFGLRLNSNIDPSSSILDSSHWHTQLPHLKIMLLNQGIRIDKDTENAFWEFGGINFQEFEAVDLSIRNQLYISVPYKTKLSGLSPFEIVNLRQGHFYLSYVDAVLTEIRLRSIDPDGEKITSRGLVYKHISYLGNDRLRLYHRTGCHFKGIGRGCQFCDIETDDTPIALSDIKEILDIYQTNKDIRHFLIGGGSASPYSDFSRIKEEALLIREFSDKPIYLMSLPPFDINILKEIKDAGVTQVAFNIEVYDRDIAKQYMPGKGQIPLSVYENAFIEAVRLWGKTGNVRSIMIVGLEPVKTLLEGIHFLCRLGVSPILSLFKPIAGTPLENMMPPSNTEIFEIYCEVMNICNHYGVEQGPHCPYCEDNTLTLHINKLQR